MHDWSVKDQDAFWSEFTEFTKIKWRKKPTSTKTNLPNNSFLGTEWFPNGALNFAENLLPENSDKIVVIAKAEGTLLRQYSATQLKPRCCESGLGLEKIWTRKK